MVSENGLDRIEFEIHKRLGTDNRFYLNFGKVTGRDKEYADIVYEPFCMGSVNCAERSRVEQEYGIKRVEGYGCKRELVSDRDNFSRYIHKVLMPYVEVETRVERVILIKDSSQGTYYVRDDGEVFSCYNDAKSEGGCCEVKGEWSGLTGIERGRDGVSCALCVSFCCMDKVSKVSRGGTLVKYEDPRDYDHLSGELMAVFQACSVGLVNVGYGDCSGDVLKSGVLEVPYSDELAWRLVMLARKVSRLRHYLMSFLTTPEGIERFIVSEGMPLIGDGREGR